MSTHINSYSFTGLPTPLSYIALNLQQWFSTIFHDTHEEDVQMYVILPQKLPHHIPLMPPYSHPLKEAY